jgi:hypothetical protein
MVMSKPPADGRMLAAGDARLLPFRIDHQVLCLWQFALNAPTSTGTE